MRRTSSPSRPRLRENGAHRPALRRPRGLRCLAPRQPPPSGPALRGAARVRRRMPPHAFHPRPLPLRTVAARPAEPALHSIRKAGSPCPHAFRTDARVRLDDPIEQHPVGTVPLPAPRRDRLGDVPRRPGRTSRTSRSADAAVPGSLDDTRLPPARRPEGRFPRRRSPACSTLCFLNRRAAMTRRRRRNQEERTTRRSSEPHDAARGVPSSHLREEGTPRGTRSPRWATGQEASPALRAAATWTTRSAWWRAALRVCSPTGLLPWASTCEVP
jgi:hypothetical protein